MRLLRSAAFQISAALTLIILISTLAVSYVILRKEKELFTREILSRWHFQARTLARDLTEPMLYEDIYTLYALLKHTVETNPDLLGAELRSKNLNLHLRYPRDHFSPTGALVISEAITSPDLGTLGEIRLFLRRGVISERLLATEKRLLLLVLVILINSILAALWVARRVVHPVLVLNREAQRIARGEFGHTVKISAVGEIRELVETFNRMSQSLKEMVEELKRTHERMARAEMLAALGQFAAGVAHEIKNPLTSISLLVELAARGRARPEDFEILRKEIRRLDHIVKSFLDFAKSRREDLPREKVKLNDLVEEVLTILRPQARRQGVEIRAELSELPSFESSPEALKQILLNLALNALQAMPEGGRLTVRTALKDGKVWLSVEDTGPGIPEDIRRRIFEPFFTTKPEGTGLGLSITHNLVKALSGEIHIHSREGAGTRVEIELPLSPEEQDEEKNTPPSH